MACRAGPHTLIRWKNILLFDLPLSALSSEARAAKGSCGVARELPPDYRSRWAPPAALRALGPAPLLGARRRPVPGDPGRAASVVTDEVVRFTATGSCSRSGRELPADIIVTATGLNLLAWGGIRLDVEGTVLKAGECLASKGLLLSNVPNCSSPAMPTPGGRCARSCRRSMSVGYSVTWDVGVTCELRPAV